MNKGVLYALGAYGIWGFFPLYWKMLGDVPSSQIIAHRIMWSAVFLMVLLTLRRNWKPLIGALRSPRVVLTYTAASVILTTNWLIYVWAINADKVVESSLGYFINPLVSILLGVLFLGERMRAWQWVAVGVAALGVLDLALSYGQIPWIALSLALSFGTYGLIKKRAPLAASHGLALETGTMFLPALAFVVVQSQLGVGAFGLSTAAQAGGGLTPLATSLLLIGGGVVTTIPLLLFSSATQMIPLSWIGLLQYITPTAQFLMGVFLYHEPLTHDNLVGFVVVWVGLAIFGVEGILARRGDRAVIGAEDAAAAAAMVPAGGE